MTENAKVFCRMLSEDDELAREFTELLDRLRASRAEAILGFAESHGIELVAEDLVPEAAEGALDEEELTLVTGGRASNDDDDYCGVTAPHGPSFGWLWVG